MKWIVAAICFALVTLVFAILLARQAGAEELPRGLGHPKAGEKHWYEPGCCNRTDCEALPDEAVSPIGGGFRVRYIASSGLTVDVTVPYSQTRLSRDGRYHGCASKVRFLCLYAHFGV